MSDLGLDAFLPAVPMGMNGLAEVMAALAGSPARAASCCSDRFAAPASGRRDNVRGIPMAHRDR